MVIYLLLAINAMTLIAVIFEGVKLMADITGLLDLVASINNLAVQINAKIDTLIANAVPQDQIDALTGGLTSAQATLTEALNK